VPRNQAPVVARWLGGMGESWQRKWKREGGGWKAREWLGFRGVCARRVDLML